MKRRLLILVPVILISLCSSGQDSLTVKLTGKWGICYSLDTVDLLCKEPFNYYNFEDKGRCQHGEMTIMGEKIPVTGIWKYEDGKVEIVYDKHPNYSYPKEVFKEIKFINDDLFYYKVFDKIENPGHWVFYSFKRVK